MPHLLQLNAGPGICAGPILPDCLAALIVIAIWWRLLRLRTRQLAANTEIQLAERLAEQDRIACELHETLLQGLQTLMLPFQSVADAISEEDPRRRLIEDTLETAERVFDEGREQMRDLRAREHEP